jgi:hypothetical protein
MRRPLPTRVAEPCKKFHFFSLTKKGSLERRKRERKKERKR